MVTIKSTDGVLAEIRQFVAAQFLIDDNTNGLKDTDLLFEGGIIDSAGAITLVVHLEQRYSIEILDEELFPENFATVERIAEFIQRKRLLNVDRDTGGDQP